MKDLIMETYKDKTNNYVLPTLYNGITYRSRTEARWARFFDAAGIRFEYEKEGYSLSSGNYLPDFSLSLYPHDNLFYRGTGGVFAEVKGDKFTDKEKEKCFELCKVTNQPVLMLCGVPGFRVYDLMECKNSDSPDVIGKDRCYTMGYLDEIKNGVVERSVILCTSDCRYFPFYYYPGFEDAEGYFLESDWYDSHAEAIHAARNERFGVYPELER